MANSQQKPTQLRHSRSPSAREPHPKCGKTLTEQNHEKACNINSIMERYTKTGLIDHVNKHEGQFIDATGVDYQKAQNLIALAKTEFEELPAAARDAFDNDVTNYLDMISQEDGADQLRGILDPQEQKQDPENDPAEPDSAGTEAPEGPGDTETPVT